MKLQKMTIKAFRGFLDVSEFSLDGDIILLTGSNGLGKTTFFDAFEWCLTGKLKRYESSKIEKKQHPYIVNRFANDNASVKASFISRTDVIEFTREGNENKTALSIKVNDNVIPRRDVNEKLLEILVSDDELLGQIRHDDLEYLLLRSHLLEQELTSEFLRSVSPTNRFSQISKILGADRFEAFYKKVSGSYRFIDAELANEEKKLANAVDELEKKETELNNERELLKTLPEHKSRKALHNQCKETLQRLKQYLPNVPQIEEVWLDLNTADFYDSMKRNCKSLLQRAENLLDKTVAGKSGLSNIHQEFKDIDRITESSKKHRAKLEEIKKIQENLQKDGEAPAKELRTLEKQEVKIGQSIAGLTTKGKILRSLKQRSEEYKAKKQEKESLSKELSNTHKEIDKKINLLNSQKKEHETKKVNFENYEQRKVHLVAEVEKWEFVKKEKPELNNLKKEIEQVQLNLTNYRKALVFETDAINKVEIRLRKKQKEKEEISQKFAELNEIVSERSQLLGILKVHIEGGNCPLCGYNWISPETLLNQIQRVSGHDEEEIAQLKTEIVNIEKEISKLSRELNKRKTNLGTTKERINEDSNRIRQLQVNEQGVKKAAAEYDLSVEKLLSMDHQSIENSLKKSKKDLNKKNISIANLRKKASEQSQNVTALESEIAKMEIDEDTKKKRLQHITNFLREFEKEVEEAGIAEGQLSEISKHVEQIEHNIQELTQKKEKTIEGKKLALKKIETLNREKEDQAEKYETLYLELEQYQEQISIFSSRIERYNCKNYRDISEKLSVVSKREQDIRHLIEDVAKHIESIESARARMRYDYLEGEMKELKRKERILRKGVESIQESKKFAERLNRAARKETRTVIENLIKSHEPLINEFYRQINPHPRFTIINFIPKGIPGRGGGNAVFIEATDEYEKKVINPSLTFSSAQLNVLAISIFLAIHTNQSWSKLDTIMMDDPIQNMDDLNILSYIDLIRKIRKKKQIIISTHDANIYRLMRRKLQPTDKEKLICYEYKSFDVNGPKIKEDRISSS